MPPRHTRPALVAAMLLLALGASPALAAGEAAHKRAPQACPKVKDEIVDLDMLAEGLKNSGAVGMLEKLRLKSSIDDLIGRFKAFHAGAKRYSLAQLQEQYDLLMMRIAAALHEKDVVLHGQLCNAWELLWSDLQDRARFKEKFS
jgi:hypothetical protein